MSSRIRLTGLALTIALACTWPNAAAHEPAPTPSATTASPPAALDEASHPQPRDGEDTESDIEDDPTGSQDGLTGAQHRLLTKVLAVEEKNRKAISMQEALDAAHLASAVEARDRASDAAVALARAEFAEAAAAFEAARVRGVIHGLVRDMSTSSPSGAETLVSLIVAGTPPAGAQGRGEQRTDRRRRHRRARRAGRRHRTGSCRVPNHRCRPGRGGTGVRRRRGQGG